MCCWKVSSGAFFLAMRLHPVKIGLGHAPLAGDAFVDQRLAVVGERLYLALDLSGELSEVCVFALDKVAYRTLLRQRRKRNGEIVVLRCANVLDSGLGEDQIHPNLVCRLLLLK